jgi:hypothetical protein
MKLIDLVKYLKDDTALERFYFENNINAEDESPLAYMENELHIDSEIHLLSWEETEDEVVIEKDGKRFIQLFPLNLGVDFYSYFEDYFIKENYDEKQIAKRLLEYRINDA